MPVLELEQNCSGSYVEDVVGLDDRNPLRRGSRACEASHEFSSGCT